MKKKLDMRRDRRGFTLVELLVSVLILAAVAAPLLHTFVTSASTATRSRKLGDATLAAQTVGESIEATHVSQLATMFVAGRVVDDGSFLKLTTEDEPFEGTENADKYTFSISGISSGTSTFDAYVTMDAAASAVYEDINNVLVTEYTPMEAVFAQPADVYENPDWMAADEFSNEAMTLAGTSAVYNFDYFLSHYTRNVEISISQIGEECVGIARYDYSCPVTYTVTVVLENGTTQEESREAILTASYSYEFYRSATGELSSVYIFYYPKYGDITDHIDILNPGDLPLSIFLIKQKAIERAVGSEGNYEVKQKLDTAISALDADYDAYLRLYESIGAANQIATIFSNIKTDLATGLSAGSCIYEIYRGSSWYKNGTLTGLLVEKAAQNRMYQVTIALYETGTSPGDSTPVYTLTTSKLD